MQAVFGALVGVSIVMIGCGLLLLAGPSIRRLLPQSQLAGQEPTPYVVNFIRRFLGVALLVIGTMMLCGALGASYLPYPSGE